MCQSGLLLIAICFNVCFVFASCASLLRRTKDTHNEEPYMVLYANYRLLVARVVIWERRKSVAVDLFLVVWPILVYCKPCCDWGIAHRTMGTSFVHANCSLKHGLEYATLCLTAISRHPFCMTTYRFRWFVHARSVFFSNLRLHWSSYIDTFGKRTVPCWLIPPIWRRFMCFIISENL